MRTLRTTFMLLFTAEPYGVKDCSFAICCAQIQIPWLHAALKSQLVAKRPKGREAYTDAKSQFVRSVLQGV